MNITVPEFKMLIAELRLDVAELKAEVQSLRTENKALLEDRRRCESEQFEQKVMIAGLKQQNAEQAKTIAKLEGQIDELQQQAGVWKKVQAEVG